MVYLGWAIICAALGWGFREDAYTVERLRHSEVERLAEELVRKRDPNMRDHVVINSAFTDIGSGDGEPRWVVLVNRPGTHDLDEALVLEMSPDGGEVLETRRPAFPGTVR